MFAIAPRVGELARGPQPAFPDAATCSGGGPLRDHGKRDRFAKIDSRRRFAEVNAAGRSGSLDVAAERRKVQIGFQNAVL
ncbi:MAG TPA: hypothetical protein VGE89_14970 [Bryobacteraceae bacterium]